MACIVCQVSGPQLCSWDCRESAQAELDKTVEALGALEAGEVRPGRPIGLALRIDDLTAALKNWSDAPADPPT